MPTVTIREIDQRLRELPAEKLAVVYDFVCFLAERETTAEDETAASTMIVSEAVLARDWARPEEDEAWSHL